MISRVSTYDYLGSLAFYPAGLALAGPLADAFGMLDRAVGERRGRGPASASSSCRGATCARRTDMGPRRRRPAAPPARLTRPPQSASPVASHSR